MNTATLTKPTLPEIMSDEAENTFNNNDYAHYILAVDGELGDNFAFKVDLFDTNSDDAALCYENSYANDGVANLFADDAKRTDAFEALLLSFEAAYRIDFLICLEECVSGRWFELDAAFFDSARDRDAFVAFLDVAAGPAAKVKNATEIVKQTSYTVDEAVDATLAVTAMVEAGTITKRSGAAYKAHISRRTKWR